MPARNQPEGVAGFGARLQLLLAPGDTQQAFAKRIGVSLSNLRKWLTGGGLPRLDNAVAISDVADVSIHWLATGEGPRERNAVKSAASALATVNIDESVMITVVCAVDAALEQHGLRLPPERYAKIIAAAYDFTVSEPDTSRRTEVASRTSERILRLVS